MKLASNIIARVCHQSWAALLLFAIGSAEIIAQPTPVPETGRLIAARRTMDELKALAIAGKTQPVVAFLEQTTSAQRNSVEWHLEVTARLISLAAALRAEGHLAAQRDVAEQALQRLVAAENVASNHKLRARALEHQGLIRERFLDDTLGAKENYRRAVAADPGNRNAAKAFQRFEKIETRLAEKRGDKS